MLTGAADGSSSGEIKPLTVMCVEDNPDVLQLIRFALEADQGIECQQTFEDGNELLHLLESGETPPDVIVTDWSMPGVSGDVLVRTVRDAWPNVRIIVYTAYSHASVVESACKAGAWGVVSKEATQDTLLTAIREVADGRMVIKC